MAEIKWTKEAVVWLECIYDYIAKDNKKAAAKVIDSIYFKVQTLKRFPQQGYRYFDHPGHEIRILLWAHYRIAYLIKDNSDIDILGIFHGALDITQYLN